MTILVSSPLLLAVVDDVHDDTAAPIFLVDGNVGHVVALVAVVVDVTAAVDAVGVAFQKTCLNQNFSAKIFGAVIASTTPSLRSALAADQVVESETPIIAGGGFDSCQVVSGF